MKNFTLILLTLLQMISISEAVETMTTGVLRDQVSSKMKEDYLIKSGCQFYNFKMELVYNLPYQMCLSVEIHQRRFLFFKNQAKRWFTMDEDRIRLLDEAGNELCSAQGRFNHDIAFDSKRQLLIAIDQYEEEINKQDYSFFQINYYNTKCELVDQWKSSKHLDDLEKIGKWKEYQGIKVPLTIRIKKRNIVTQANYIEWRESPWRQEIPAESLIIHIKYLGATIALNQSGEIVWSKEYITEINESDLLDIHTPQLLDNGSIAIFNNALRRADGKYKSGAQILESSEQGPKLKLIYTTRDMTPQQHTRNGAFGSVQYIPESRGYFVSTGSEYGGVALLNENFEVIFEWLNPILIEREGEVFPKPIYRATLVSNFLGSSMPN